MTTPTVLRDRPDAGPASRVTWLAAVHRAIAVLALLALLRFSAPLLLPIATALVLWLLFGRAAEWLERQGVPPVLAAVALAFGPPAVVAGAAYLAAPACRAGLAAASDALHQTGRLLATLGGQADATAGSARWLAGRFDWNGDAALLAWAERHAPGALLGAVSASMLLFFLLLGQRSLTAGLLRALPDLPARNRFAQTLAEARRGVVAFVLVMGAMNLALALATGACLAALGVPRAPFWAALTFVLVFVPYLGPMAVAALLVVAGLQTFGGGLAALAPAGAFLALHAVEANLLSPWAMGSRLALGRPALLVSVMAGAWVGGVTGGLLGVPVLIALAAALRASPGASVLKALLASEGAVSDPGAASAPGVGAAPGVSSLTGLPRRADE